MDGSPSIDDAGSIGRVRQVLKLGVGGNHFKEGIDLAVVEGRVPPPNDLHVLLRHRPERTS